MKTDIECEIELDFEISSSSGKRSFLYAQIHQNQEVPVTQFLYLHNGDKKAFTERLFTEVVECQAQR